MKTANWIDSIDSAATQDNALIRAVDTLFDWVDRARSRRALGQLDDRMLTDIGLSRADAWLEQHKHFWEE